MSDYISVRDQDVVTLRRIADGAVMYRGPWCGPYTPVRPPTSDADMRYFARHAYVVHPDWSALPFDNRAQIVRETGADPTLAVPRAKPSVRPGYERVAEFVGSRLVVRERRR